ncbi:recombinase family protein [Streptoverticillium reticulum]|uniref:recombinase family protein n=1 Tax=Streptoverticillium reticulum TaxID=1433415 RepID=UPI0039BF0A42
MSGIDDPLIAQLRKQGRTTTLDLSTGYASYVPQRPGGYLRLSMEDINEERRTRKKETNRKTAFERQTEDIEAKRKALGWGKFAKLYEDPATSAYKKRKVTRPDGSVDWVVLRPAFQRMLKDLLSGFIDGVIFYDLDRLVRQPRDLEDLANVVQETKRPAVGATSELNLVREADCNMARIMCVMLLKQSQDTSRRVARDTLGAAEVGIPIGRLGYGWVRKGEEVGRIVEDEAEVVRRIFREFTEDSKSFNGITADLNADKIPSPGGKHWDVPSVKTILVNPRYAGMVLYEGSHRIEASKQHDGLSKLLTDEKGNPMMGSWDAIVTPQEWFRAQTAMKQRRESGEVDTTNYGGIGRGKYLLTGIVRCSKCKTPLESYFNSKRGYHTYRCPSRGRGTACGSTSRKMAPLDDLVDLLMKGFIEKELSKTSDPGDAEQQITERRTALEAEEQEQVQEKARLESKWESGKLADLGWSRDDYDEHIGRISKKLREINDNLSALGPVRVHQPAAEVAEQWNKGGIPEKRALLKRYMEGIQLLPSPRGRGAFDADTVIPLWRHRKNSAIVPGQTEAAETEGSSAPQ